MAVLTGLFDIGQGWTVLWIRLASGSGVWCEVRFRAEHGILLQRATFLAMLEAVLGYRRIVARMVLLDVKIAWALAKSGAKGKKVSGDNCGPWDIVSSRNLSFPLCATHTQRSFFQYLDTNCNSRDGELQPWRRSRSRLFMDLDNAKWIAYSVIIKTHRDRGWMPHSATEIEHRTIDRRLQVRTLPPARQYHERHLP